LLAIRYNLPDSKVLHFTLLHVPILS
jgi:hypothetical protein